MMRESSRFHFLGAGGAGENRGVWHGEAHPHPLGRAMGWVRACRGSRPLHTGGVESQPCAMMQCRFEAGRKRKGAEVCAHCSCSIRAANTWRDMGLSYVERAVGGLKWILFVQHRQQPKVAPLAASSFGEERACAQSGAELCMANWQILSTLLVHTQALPGRLFGGSKDATYVVAVDLWSYIHTSSPS